MSNQWTISTALPVQFIIKKSTGVFTKENKDILTYGTFSPGSRRLLVIDMKVSNLYLNQILSYFQHHQIETHVVVLNAVEQEKNTETLLYLLQQMEQFNVSRRHEPVIAIGGGVLLDIVGLACSLYRRGVPYIRVPTTLIGLVDASVGAKTAVNFMHRRNRTGSYYPPVAAYLDKTFLKTLELVEISSGLGEILKMAIIKDKRLFELLQEYGGLLYRSKLNEGVVSDEVIDRSIRGMKEELENNLWEIDLQRSVDFGHSFSPIIEMRSIEDNTVPSLTHGQAVTLDCVFSSILSYNRGHLSKQEALDIIRVAKEMRLPVSHPFFAQPSMIWESLVDTVKHRNGNQYLPIPKKIGMCMFLNDVTYDEIVEVSELMERWCK